MNEATVNPFDGLDMTGWLIEHGYAARATKTGLIAWLTPGTPVLEASQGVFNRYAIPCTSLAAAYALANQIAEATGGWKE